MAGHPHGCGESLLGNHRRSSIIGSSPRVWGKHTAADGITRACRVIPTGVGKAAASSAETPKKTGHPHGCGESDGVSINGTVKSGSSPRVWGKPPARQYRRPSERVIPTGVGKACGNAHKANDAAGHPHGCGESCCWANLNRSPTGSSPRVWGKPNPSTAA